MEIVLSQFLIVCPLTLLAGFVDAVAGGGGLISLPAYSIAGLPMHFAIATNKLSSSMGTSISTFRFARKGYIPWKQAIFYVPCALAGSTFGARLALLLNDYVFKIIMLFILPLTAIYVVRSKNLSQEKEAFPVFKTVLLGMVIAAIIGVYDGFYGPGTGTFLILLLSTIAHMKIDSANGVTKVINLTTNIAALIVFLENRKVLLPLGLAAGCFNIIGNYLGTNFFETGGTKAVQPSVTRLSETTLS